MKLQEPKTIDDFKSIEKSILELMNNPYVDSSMYANMEDKLKQCRVKINELTIDVKPLKVYTVEFDGIYPVGSCLILTANNDEEANKIASETIYHTTEFKVTEVVLDEPKVIEYLSGDY